jgi:acetyl-CoA acyltransferase
MNAYIIDGIRTPIGSFGGSLSGIRTDDLAAMVIRSLVAEYPGIPAGA